MPEEILYIQKNEVLTNAENYAFLREEGLKYLQALSGKIWTDYNIHDPGVTILELLCYAITDLGYRTRFPMADLLTRGGASAPDKTNSFYTASEILTTHPITPEDYRRLLIDIVPGLKNVWLEEIDNADLPRTSPDTTYFRPRTEGYAVRVDTENHRLEFTPAPTTDPLLHIHGLYRVKIEMEDWETLVNDKTLRSKVELALDAIRKPGDTKVSLKKTSKNTTKRQFEDLVRKTLHSYRNLCEDFETVTIMTEEQVTVCMDIEVEPDTDINELIKKVYRVIYNYASPSLKFYSLQEMLDKGKTIEEIYEGTVPGKGFVDYEELKTRFNRQRTVMYTSDLINLIMNLEGVTAVKKLLLTSTDEAGHTLYDSEKYCLHLYDAENSSFRFKRLGADNKPVNRITFFKSNLPFKALEPGDDFDMQEKTAPENFTADLPLPQGTNRELGEYLPVQHEFPASYYSGLEKMPESEATPLRQRQRMQLKGYLLFFEQLLANFLAQLNNLPALFSWNDPDGFNTYAVKTLSQITAPGETLLDNVSLFDPPSDYMQLLNDPLKNLDRRNRLLDSLLARFNEKFVDYSVFKYTHNNEPLSIEKQMALVRDKCALLKDYAGVSANRSHAIDINEEVILTHLNNLSGFQRYITAILGINITEDHYLAKVLRNPLNGEPVLDANGQPYYFDIRDISFDEGFGMHMIEHVLLRPLFVDEMAHGNIDFLSLCCCDNEDKEPSDEDFCSDPYSMRITVVLPGWLNLSLDMEFRRFVNTVIRANAPAHVALKICWIGMQQMYEYERTYVEFMKWLNVRESMDANPGSEDINSYNKALADFVRVINNLKNVYPPATLHDCENSERDVDGNLVNRTVILNRTTLGDAWPTGLNILPYTRPFPDPAVDDLAAIAADYAAVRIPNPPARPVDEVLEALPRKAGPMAVKTPVEKKVTGKNIPPPKTAKNKTAPVKKKPSSNKKKNKD